MADQGFPHEGKDRRLFAWLAPSTRALSWDSKLEPPSLIFSGFGFKLYLPLWWVKRLDFPTLHKFFMLRAGWHYDVAAKAYIIGFAAKVTDNASLY